MIPKVLLSWRPLYHCPCCIYFVQTPQRLVTGPTLWYIHKTTLPPSEKKEGLVALYYQVWQSASSFTRIDFRRVAIQMPSFYYWPKNNATKFIWIVCCPTWYSAWKDIPSWNHTGSQILYLKRTFWSTSHLQKTNVLKVRSTGLNLKCAWC